MASLSYIGRELLTVITRAAQATEAPEGLGGHQGPDDDNDDEEGLALGGSARRWWRALTQWLSAAPLRGGRTSDSGGGGVTLGSSGSESEARAARRADGDEEQGRTSANGAVALAVATSGGSKVIKSGPSGTYGRMRITRAASYRRGRKGEPAALPGARSGNKDSGPVPLLKSPQLLKSPSDIRSYYMMVRRAGACGPALSRIVRPRLRRPRACHPRPPT